MNLCIVLTILSTPSLPPQAPMPPQKVTAPVVGPLSIRQVSSSENSSYCSGQCTCGCQSGAACACGETKNRALFPVTKAATPTYTQPAFAPLPTVQYQPRVTTSSGAFFGRGCTSAGG